MSANQPIFIEDEPRQALVSCKHALTEPGGVVVFPTETVYGLLARSTDEDGYRRIFKMKYRPANRPLQLLVSSRSTYYRQALQQLRTRPDLFHKFANGQATVVFEPDMVPGLAGNVKWIQPGTIGLRSPAHPMLQKLLFSIDPEQPLWATSANFSDEPPAFERDNLMFFINRLETPPDVIVLSHSPLSGRPSEVVVLRDGSTLRP